MITDKEEALKAIRTKNPNVLDEISIELQNDFDVATVAADTFELQLRNFISIGSSGDDYWKKARDIIKDWDHSAQIYRQKEAQAKARGLIIDEEEALEAIRAGEARLADIMPEIVDSEMVLEAIKQYGSNQYTYAQQIGVRGISEKEFRDKVKAISEEQARWAKVDRDYAIKEAQAKARGLIIDEEEALEAIRAGEARLADIMPEIVDSEMVLEAIKQYGDSQYVYAQQIGIRGIEGKEFRDKIKIIKEEQAKEKKVARSNEVKIDQIDGYFAEDAYRQEDDRSYEVETDYSDGYLPEDTYRDDLEKKLMEEFELSKAKKVEIAKKEKAIEGLKTLEQKYEKEISKAEGKVF